MDLVKSSKVLDTLAEVVGPIPVAGPGLVILLKVASQICIAAEVRVLQPLSELPAETLICRA